MGVVLKNKGKLDKAIEAFQKAILLRPNYPEAYINMGSRLQAQPNLVIGYLLAPIKEL